MVKKGGNTHQTVMRHAVRNGTLATSLILERRAFRVLINSSYHYCARLRLQWCARTDIGSDTTKLLAKLQAQRRHAPCWVGGVGQIS
jgi:hypothetical protein